MAWSRLLFAVPLSAAALLAVALAAAGSGGEEGYPLMRIYPPEVHQAGTQNFDAARGPDGTLYFGNLHGILTYDGAWWRLIGTPSAVFAVAADDRGEVAVGTVNDLGILTADDRGTPVFTSLLDRLPEDRREVGETWTISAGPEGFVFVTDRFVLVWNGETLREVAPLETGGAAPGSFLVDDIVYLWTAEGLRAVTGGGLAAVPDGERFRDRKITLLLRWDDSRLLVGIQDEGLALWDGISEVDVGGAASRWARERRANGALRLPDGRVALSSRQGGLLVLGADGTVESVIDSATGLPDDLVRGLVLDHEGSVWLALDSEIAQVEVSSPISVFDARSGLRGRATSVTRYRGQLWIATTLGFYTLPASAAESATPRQAVPVAGLSDGGLAMVAGEDLLAATDHGIFRVHGDESPRLIEDTEDLVVYSMRSSPSDPRRVWLGLRRGMSSLLFEDGAWRFQGLIPGSPGYVQQILERDPRTLWCGTIFDGAVRLDVGSLDAGDEPPVIERFSEGEVSLFEVSERLFATLDGIYVLDEETGARVEEPSLAALDEGSSIFRLAEDARGRLWMNSRPPTVAVRRSDGSYDPDVVSLTAIPPSDLQDIVAEPDGTVWLFGEKGLYRHAGDLSQAVISPLAPRIRRVLSAGETLFGGASLGVDPPAEIAFKLRRLRVEVSPGTFRRGVRYQYRLEPLDDDWGDSTDLPFMDLAHLPEGGYAFHVRRQGASRGPGPETVWRFTVSPPWYRSPVAWVAWGLVALLAVWGYSRLRERALRRQAEQLREQVRERTRELSSTVEELRRAQTEVEEKNALLAEANVRLEELSLQDELTGVSNRRHLERALHDAWGQACDHRRPLACILLDLDHFKELNDLEGHTAGDDCLRRIGQYLSDRLRRDGYLVARFGGEEFAVLIPDAEMGAVETLAEELRAGIEALDIRHRGSGAGQVTASFGVAVDEPRPGDRPWSLIEAADRALYRAKAEGRNVVRRPPSRGRQWSSPREAG